MGIWDDTVKAAKDMLKEHVLKMGPEEPTVKESTPEHPAFKTAAQVRKKQGPGFWMGDIGD